MISKNMRAFLDMIAHSEIGAKLLAESDDGYNVIVGSTPAKPILFFNYADHPRRLITIKPGLQSTAAGRYQLLSRYFDIYRRQMRLPDFSPASQDAIAIQQIKEQSAFQLVEIGKFEEAVRKVSNIWASLPGAQYGQHVNEMDDLKLAYLNAGGEVV